MCNLYTKFVKILEVRNRTHKTGVSVSAQPKGMETDMHSVCKGKKEISALTILQYVNFINDKPIGRIKCAEEFFKAMTATTRTACSSSPLVISFLSNKLICLAPWVAQTKCKCYEQSWVLAIT